MSIFLKANWEHIIMANYEIAPEILEPFLPKGVELDLFNGECYISLVGFMFKNTKLFTIPIPFFGNFEEINLRFYVKRIEKDKSIKRGVVFINETIPYSVVAWVANKLYNENYTVVPTKHTINTLSNFKNITFKWLVDKNWNSIFVKAENAAAAMTENSLEKFIYEHYYGYTKINEHQTEEYKLQHPSWKTHKVIDYRINCDFEKMYGKYFSVLDNTKPTAVFIAEGSEVAIEWKRNRLNL